MPLSREIKPFTWSYSKLSLYEKCPSQYKFRYVKNLPYPKSTAASRGTEIHASIENYMLGNIRAKDLHPEVLQYKDLFAGIKKKKPFVEEKLAISESWEVVPWVEGWGRMVVDAYYLEPELLVAPEWKSGKVYDDHIEQRKLYGTVLLQKYPDIDEAHVKTIYVDQGFAHVTEVSREHVPDIIEEFDRRLEFLQSDDEMAPRPGWYCRFCPYSRMKDGPCKVA